jgi:hypothetical protein
MGKWREVAAWTAILALSGGAGLIMGHIPQAEDGLPTVVSLSISCGEPGTAVEVSFTDDKHKLDSAERKTTLPAFNTLVYNFPSTSVLDSLTFTVLSAKPVTISGISIISGVSDRTITADELLGQAQFLGCTAQQGGLVDIRLTPQDDRFGFRMPDRIALITPRSNRGWTLAMAILSLGILIIFKRRCPAHAFFTVTTSALVLAGLFGEALYSLKDKVDSADIFVEYSTQ